VPFRRPTGRAVTLRCAMAVSAAAATAVVIAADRNPPLPKQALSSRRRHPTILRRPSAVRHSLRPIACRAGCPPYGRPRTDP